MSVSGHEEDEDEGVKRADGRDEEDVDVCGGVDLVDTYTLA